MEINNQNVGLLWGSVSMSGIAFPIKAGMIEMMIEDRDKTPKEPPSMDELE